MDPSASGDNDSDSDVVLVSEDAPPLLVPISTSVPKIQDNSLSEEEKKETENIFERMKMASNVLFRMLYDEEPSSTNLSIQTKTFKYTKFFNHGLINDIIDTVRTKYNPPNVEPPKYEMYRNTYRQILLSNKIIPTLNTLNNLSVKANQGNVFKALLAMNFIWQKIPRTNRALIVENPEVVRKRMDYLRRMRSYRYIGKPIVYLEEVAIQRSYWNAYHIIGLHVRLCAGKSGILYSHAHADVVDNLPNVLKLITDRLTEPTVIVVADKHHHSQFKMKMPNDQSTKKELIEYLKLTNIPHDPEMHRGELLSLIQRQKIKSGADNDLEKFLKVRGHELVIRPYYDLPKLNFFSPLVETFTPEPNQRNLTTTTDIFMKKAYSMYTDEWARFENNLAEYENQIYMEDCEVENAIDKFMTMATDGFVTKYDVKNLDLHFLYSNLNKN